MSYNYYPNFADVVEDDFVAEVVGEKHKALFSGLENIGVAFEDLVSWVCCEVEVDEIFSSNESELNEENMKPLAQLLEEVKEDFEEKTELVLSVGFHDSGEDGCASDEVDGWFWQVGNAYTLTEAGKKYADKLQRRFYTVVT